MVSYTITARKTSPLTSVVVDADTRELAIQQVVDQAAEGEQVEVLQCTETLPDAPSGPSGPSGAMMSASRSKKD